MRGDAGNSWRGRLRFALFLLRATDGAGLGTRDWQADLLPGHLGTLWDPLGLHVLLTQSLFVKQVANFHDVSNDLHWACDCFLTGREVILHFFQVRSRSPALFILVPVKSFK